MAAYIEEHDYGITWVIDEPMARASHALVDDGRVWIIDPVDDKEAMEKVVALGKPVAVFQLLDRHNRDCEAIAKRLDVPHVTQPDELHGTPFESFNIIQNRFWAEKGLWWQKKHVLVVPEAVGTSKLFKPADAGAGMHIMLRMRPPRRPLGTFVPQHLLCGHGRPVHGTQATKALQEAVDRSWRDLPGAIVGIPGAFR